MTAFVELFSLIRNGMTVKQTSDAGGLPITRIETISDGTVDPSRVGYAGLDEEAAAKWVLLPGDLLFSHINSPSHVGKVALYMGTPSSLVHGMNLLCLRPNTEVVDARWAMHMIRSSVFRNKIQKFVNKAVNQASISIGNLGSVEVDVPPLDEQRRIAAILDQADGLRRMRQRITGHIAGLTRSLFIDMFGDPIRNPMGLPLAPLGEVGELDRGVSRHRPRNDSALLNGPYPLIQTGDVTRSGGQITDYSATYSELGLAQSRLWPAGTLCITIAANIAQTGVLTFDACFPDSVVGFTADKAMTTYIRAWLTFLQPILEASAPQSAQRNINLAILRGLPVPVPERVHLERFDQLVDRVQNQHQVSRDILVQYEDLFNSIQTRAFAGRF